MKFSEFEVLARCNTKRGDIFIEVRIPHEVTYHVGLTNSDCFVKSTIGAEYILGVPQIEMFLPKINKNCLKDHKKFAGVRHFYFGKTKANVENQRLVLEVEYLNTSHGNVTNHIHPDGIREVYLNLEEPYDGRACDFGESHETFCKHTLAIKAYLEH